MIDRSRSEYSIMNILTGFGGYFLNTLLGYICRIVFVQCLNADYLGINGLLTNILSMMFQRKKLNLNHILELIWDF